MKEAPVKGIETAAYIGLNRANPDTTPVNPLKIPTFDFFVYLYFYYSN